MSWQEWFERHGDFGIYDDGWGNRLSPENMYQAFKSRLLKECDIKEFMTPEQYAAWVNLMVRK